MGVPKRVPNGWKEKKVLKESKKSTKTIEKVIEKESEKEAQQIVDIKSVANLLLEKTAEAVTELNKHTDMVGNVKESIIDRADIKKLTSALKDLNDIIAPVNNEDDSDNSFIKALGNKVGDIWNEKK